MLQCDGPSHCCCCCYCCCCVPSPGLCRSIAPWQETIELNEAKKTYDRVFDPSATQQEVFDYVAKPLVSGESAREPLVKP